MNSGIVELAEKLSLGKKVSFIGSKQEQFACRIPLQAAEVIAALQLLQV